MAKKAVYLNEEDGDDKNDGLSPETAVLTGDRALDAASDEKTQEFDINGSDGYLARINAVLRKKKT